MGDEEYKIKLRDAFAACVLMSNLTGNKSVDSSTEDQMIKISKLAYKMAHFMMKERERWI